MKMTMTNELPAEIMENGIHYTLVGDYYFPTCMLADRSPNGKWASLYECYLSARVCQADLCGCAVGSVGIRADGVRRAGCGACSGDDGDVRSG